jgi:hypothetical protein
MPPIAIAAGISGISSIAGAALNRKGQTTTQTNQPLFTPAQSAVQNQLGALIQAMMAKGDNGNLTKGARNSGRTNINNQFDAINARMASDATSRGFGPGQSGKFVTNQRALEVDRSKQLTQLDTTMAEQEWMRKMGVMNMALGFSHPYGSNTSTTVPGPSMGSTIANIGGDIGSLLMLSKFMH